jgi:hypothetical protein
MAVAAGYRSADEPIQVLAQPIGIRSLAGTDPDPFLEQEHRIMERRRGEGKAVGRWGLCGFVECQSGLGRKLLAELDERAPVACGSDDRAAVLRARRVRHGASWIGHNRSTAGLADLNRRAREREQRPVAPQDIDRCPAWMPWRQVELPEFHVAAAKRRARWLEARRIRGHLAILAC